MKKMTNKWILTALIISLVALAGCSSKNNDAEGSSAPPAPTAKATDSKAETQTPAGDEHPFPVKDGSAKLTVGAPDNTLQGFSYKDNLPVWAKVEEMTGVKIEWDVQASKQYSTSMPIRMASGQKLPDIFKVEGSVKEAADDGLIIPITDLIDKYAPNTKKFFEEHPDSYKRMVAPDGQLYGFQANIEESSAYDPYGIAINKTWLDKLNLQEPKTLDDWYNVLKAFKEKDPNGNGKADEIPLFPGSGSTSMNIWGNAFGLNTDGSNGFSPDANGKLQFDYIADAEQDFIEWVHKLYTEGLIDQEFITTKTSKYSLAGQDLVGVTIGQLNHISQLEAAGEKAGIPNDWIMTLPPSSVGTDKPSYYHLGAPTGSSVFAISKDCKDPVLAVQWLDFVFGTDEGMRLMNMGIEGKSYTIVNGEPEFNDFVLNNPDGMGITDALRSLGARPTLPHAVPGKYFKKTLSKDMLIQQEKVAPYLVPRTGMAGSTLEESEAIFKYQPDINTYANAQIAKFMTGAEPLSGWDDYVKRVKDMHVDELLKARQGQYDRYMSN